MKLGIKVGPNQNSPADLDATHPACCEVYYNATKPDDYTELFADLRRRKIDVGLHFWGALSDGTWTNLAYPDQTLIDESIALMRQTIDIAAYHGFQYVNIHPGCRAKVRISFTEEKFTVLTDPVDPNVAQPLFVENAKKLHDYAASQGVVFTVETVPARVTTGWYKADSRHHPMNIYELTPDTLIAAARAGICIANDFVHTASHCITDDPARIYEFLSHTTDTLAAQTRLIHLGFLMPPFNGTDNHDMLDNPIFETDHAVPNKSQMIDLLKRFQNRDDIWVLVEPHADHVANYFWAKQLIDLM